jgi:3-methylfumaryl-CoA hydratase
MTEIDIEQLKSWEGRSESSEEVLWPTPARALAATLDGDPDALVEGDPLPPLCHWVYFPILTRSSELARDGHAKKGAFMPPVPFPRRMFAGARVDCDGTLRLGDRVHRTVTIESVIYKEGRSGPLIFVTVGYELRNDAGARLVEQQDLAYRPAMPPQRGSAASEPATFDRADFEREIFTDEALLFRYSALTFNGHRIHYDLPYAQAEGYPSLVVHGPLTATLLADLALRGTGAPWLAHFSFRARRAFLLGEPIRLVGRRQDNEVTLLALDQDGVARVEARAVLP